MTSYVFHLKTKSRNKQKEKEKFHESLDPKLRKKSESIEDRNQPMDFSSSSIKFPCVILILGSATIC